MRRAVSILLAVGMSLTAVIVQSTEQNGWAQSQKNQEQEVKRLQQLAEQQTQQGKPQQAIETLQQVLVIARQIPDKQLEARVLLGIGFNLSNIGQPQKALDDYNQALLIFREVDDRTGEAITLNNIGLVYQGIGQRQKALDDYNQALPIFRQVGDRAGEAITLNNIGGVYDNIGQCQKALEYYDQALSIKRELDDRKGEATTLNNIGGVYDNIGQCQKALKYYNQALLIARDLGDYSLEATALNNIGAVYRDIGQAQKALDFFNQALPIIREMGDRTGEATTLNNIGAVYRDIGQAQKALDFFNQALPIIREVGDRAGEASTLNNIGAVYKEIGQPQKALDFFNQALPIIQEVGDHSSEAAATLSNIGEVYSEIGQPQKGLEYYKQALPITREVGDRAGEASTLNNIGAVYKEIGQLQKGLEYYKQALPITREVGDRAGEASTLNNIGAVYKEIGQLQKGLEYYKQALPITREVGDRTGEASTLNNIGAVYREIGKLTEATKYLEQSASLTLELRRGLIRDNRFQFLQAERGTPIALVDVLIQQKEAALAYQWANLATTADLIDYNRLNNAKVNDPAAQKAIDNWNQENQQLQLISQRLRDKFSDTLSKEVRQEEAKVNQLAEAISQQYPEVAELFETKPTDITQLQAVIPVNTTVIHPVLLTNSIALFVLTRDKLTVTRVPLNSVDIDQLINETFEQITNYKNSNYEDNLSKLYTLLIEPIESQIQVTHSQQLSIIATGKLRYIPFEALWDEKTNKYLLEKYPISYLTRLSVHSLQTTQKVNSPAAKKILALGNPIPVEPLALPGTETEVEKITKIFPGSEALIHDQATFNTFETQAPRFSYLHLATHGCFQSGGCPKLGLEENTILFADKRLKIGDATLLRLENVDLITLSACQTAVIADTKGEVEQETAEPISGLAYIFERAGAKAVISSLWSAPDEATEEIMVKFYSNLKVGMSKGEALRQAKLSEIQRHPHPYFWSPFVLIGDPQ